MEPTRDGLDCILYEISVVPMTRLFGEVEKEIGVKRVCESVRDGCHDADKTVEVAKSGDRV